MKLLLILTLLLMGNAEARKKPQYKASIYDFDAEKIEGERKRPNLMVQISSGDVSFDSIYYLRKDFNDYHLIDKNLRPKTMRKSR